MRRKDDQHYVKRLSTKVLRDEHQEMALSNLTNTSSKDANGDPGNYARNNEDQRKFNLRVLDMVEKDFVRRDDRHLQFLDVGCGTGDFTCRWLLPGCPPHARIIGVDSSDEMLSYARQMFVHPRIVYEHLDIGGNVEEFADKYGTFDRIYSFFCLNWVREQHQAIRNVATLLSFNGECLLVFPAWSRSRTPWMQLARLNRWRTHKKLFESFVPKSQVLEDDAARLCYLREMVTSAGMELRRCEITLCKPHLWDAAAAIDFQISIHPGFKRLSAEEVGRIKKDVARALQKFDSKGEPYKGDSIYVVHAKKCLA